LHSSPSCPHILSVVPAERAGVPTKATIKQADGDQFVVKTLDRSTLWEMHTPQVMPPEVLQRGFEKVRAENLVVTDDVSIVEHLGLPVFITKGSYNNLKITTPDDIAVAERILAGTESLVAS